MRKLIVLALLATAASLSGCRGYTQVRPFRSDIKTVYVQAFDNRTFRRGLEVPLTRAIEDEIKRRTPFLFASKDRADSILSGELTDFQERTQIRSEDDVVLLTRVSATVRFRWRDRLTGADIVPEQTVRESARLFEDVEATLHDLAFQEVAKRVVEHMQEPW